MSKVETEIRTRLAALSPTTIELHDDSQAHAGHAGAAAGGGHFELTIVSPQFAGKPAVARHRMVYEALGDLMHGPIHAMQINAYTPDQL